MNSRDEWIVLYIAVIGIIIHTALLSDGDTIIAKGTPLPMGQTTVSITGPGVHY